MMIELFWFIQYDKLKQINEEEYLAAVAKVKGYYAGMESVEGVCRETKDCLLKCYRDNKDRSLLCSDEVKKFEACVQQFRLNMAKST